MRAPFIEQVALVVYGDFYTEYADKFRVFTV